MVRTTVSLRIGVPLYDLNGAVFNMSRITVLPDVRLTVILVDAGVPTVLAS